MYARSLRHSYSDYDVILMTDFSYQTPPGYHQCTFGGSRKPYARARRPVRLCQTVKLDELYRNGSSRVLLAKTHCVKQGEGARRDGAPGREGASGVTPWGSPPLPGDPQYSFALGFASSHHKRGSCGGRAVGGRQVSPKQRHHPHKPSGGRPGPGVGIWAAGGDFRAFKAHGSTE